MLDRSGDIVDLLRNHQAGPDVYPGVSAGRDEQITWVRAAVLFGQSFHMVDFAVEGLTLVA